MSRTGADRARTAPTGPGTGCASRDVRGNVSSVCLPNVTATATAAAPAKGGHTSRSNNRSGVRGKLAAPSRRGKGYEADDVRWASWGHVSSLCLPNVSGPAATVAEWRSSKGGARQGVRGSGKKAWGHASAEALSAPVRHRGPFPLLPWAPFPRLQLASARQQIVAAQIREVRLEGPRLLSLPAKRHGPSCNGGRVALLQRGCPSVPPVQGSWKKARRHHACLH